MSIPRQGHRKSRYGCSQCKARRVKCDEQAPCHHCVRRREPCSLVGETSPAQSTSTVHSSPSTAGGAVDDQIAAPHHNNDTGPIPQSMVPSQQWAQDLYLMQHFVTSDAYKIGYDEVVNDVWRDYVPKLAAKNTFLMHAILAQSAAHLRITEPENREDWNVVCTRHSNQSLPTFREVLHDLRKDNAESAFCMAALCPLLTLSSLTYHDKEGLAPCTLQEILHLIVLTRGISMAMITPWNLLQGTQIAVMWRKWPLNEQSVVLPLEMQQQLEDLRSLAKTGTGAQEVYDDAISTLETNFKQASRPGIQEANESGITMTWAFHVSVGFANLLEARDPVALVILTYWIMFTAWSRRWFSRGFGEVALENVIKEIPDAQKYERLLDWPRKQLAEGLPAFPLPT